MKTLNPGSKEAQKQGCTCPVMDNHHGEGFPDGKGGISFWQSADCPLHGKETMELLKKVRNEN